MFMLENSKKTFNYNKVRQKHIICTYLMYNYCWKILCSGNDLNLAGQFSNSYKNYTVSITLYNSNFIEKKKCKKEGVFLL